MRYLKLFENKKDLIIPDGWEEIKEKGKTSLYKKFKFEDFSEAFRFISKVAKLAEKLNHHPYWANIYNVVEINLSTHDAGNKVTKKDIEMALLINKF